MKQILFASATFLIFFSVKTQAQTQAQTLYKNNLQVVTSFTTGHSAIVCPGVNGPGIADALVGCPNINPTSPTGLTAGTTTASTVPLSWTASATGYPTPTYTVKYGTSSGSLSTYSGCTSISGTNCTVSGLNSSTLYYFDIVAANTGGSATSSTISATTAAPYSGVADVESSISLYWGLTAASLALANSGVVMADLSDNTNTCTGVRALSTGYLDTNVGTYCTGGRTVAAVCTADGAGACSYGGSMRVTKVYQQIGATVANLTSASYAVSPYFILSGWNGKPMAACASSQTMSMSGTIAGVPYPYIMGASFAQVANFTGSGVILNASQPSLQSEGVNTIGGYNYNFLSATATNATGPTDFTLAHAHRVEFSINGAESQQGVVVDGGTQVTDTIPYAAGIGTSVYICSDYIYNYADDFWSAFWIDPTAVSVATQQAATSVALP